MKTAIVMDGKTSALVVIAMPTITGTTKVLPTISIEASPWVKPQSDVVVHKATTIEIASTIEDGSPPSSGETTRSTDLKIPPTTMSSIATPSEISPSSTSTSVRHVRRLGSGGPLPDVP